jgi:hypothetical protein
MFSDKADLAPWDFQFLRKKQQQIAGYHKGPLGFKSIFILITSKRNLFPSRTLALLSKAKQFYSFFEDSFSKRLPTNVY